MNNAIELERLGRTIRDTDLNAQSTKRKLDIVENELDHLSTVEIQLEQNIGFLRKERVVTLAIEFRKAKQDLDKTQKRLAFLRIDRDNLKKAFDDTELYLDKLREAYAKLYRASVNNVVPGKFGKTE